MQTLILHLFEALLLLPRIVFGIYCSSLCWCAPRMLILFLDLLAPTTLVNVYKCIVSPHFLSIIKLLVSVSLAPLSSYGHNANITIFFLTDHLLKHSCILHHVLQPLS